MPTQIAPSAGMLAGESADSAPEKPLPAEGHPSLPRRLLLTSVCRPLGTRYGDGHSVGYELLHAQVTRAQGCFSPRSYQVHFSLEYIAHNLEIPAVVLQYPTERELIRELKKGYAFVGISFIMAVLHKMKRAVELIRRYSPQSKIILGGYGTVLPDEELKPWGDFICREEGVAYLRRLFGETPLEMPYDHPVIVNGLKVFSMSIGDNGMIFAGLGCPNGCDFCATSHFFKRRHIRLLPRGRDIFNVMMRYREARPSVAKFTVLDEDFLLNKKRAMEYLDCVREAKVDLPMFVFSSVRALSQYTVEELLEMGINGLWMGYEGRRSNYAKQQGRPIDDLIAEFRQHGIHVLASMIVGFDYQTPEIVRQELDQLLALEPTFSQFLIYGPTPGTPFYDRVMAEGKIRDKYTRRREAYYRRCTGFYSMTKHPTMTAPQIQGLQRECFRQDFARLGPSLIRAIDSWWLGYQKLRHHSNARLRMVAERYRADILNGMPAFGPAMVLGPSREARRKARRLFGEIVRGIGPIPLQEKVRTWLAVPMAAWTQLALKIDWLQHPPLTRTAYRITAAV